MENCQTTPNFHIYAESCCVFLVLKRKTGAFVFAPGGDDDEDHFDRGP